jgi:hypothetical protein
MKRSSSIPPSSIIHQNHGLLYCWGEEIPLV